jgi:pyruvate ferredoxin oxidoreductase alpha subunit
MLYTVAGWRAPFVLVNVSRGLAAPLTLEPDHNDILAARDSGCLQIHCATCQEVLDTTLLAFRLAEDARVRLPVIVNLDGFYLSFTREPVTIPEADVVDAFLPPFQAGNMAFRASMPTSQAVVVLGGSPYSYFRYEMHLAALKALDVYDEIAAEFAAQFGRTHGAIEAHRCEDAEIVFFMMGSFATKAKAAVDALRAAGHAVGLVRPRLLRPFPATHLQRVLAGKRGVAVIDQNLSMGKGGVLHAEVASVLYGRPDAPAILASFIGGLGGRDITDEEFFEIARITREAVTRSQTPPPRLLYNRDELLQIQKLQAIAHVERQELREKP